MKYIRRSAALLMAGLFCLSCGCAATPTPSAPSVNEPAKGIEMCGLYTVQFYPQYAPFWKACGIDTIQLVGSGMDMSGDEQQLSIYINALGNQVNSAKDMGFDVYVTLLSNFRATKEGEGWHEALFDVADQAEMDKRLAVLERTVIACKNADGFNIIAGDPGGYTNVKATSTLANFVYLCKEFIKVIRAHAPEANVNVNPWSVTSFQTPVQYPGYVEFWQEESRLTAAMLEVANFIGPDIGIEFPCHNYYRPLAIRLYENAYGQGCDIPLYPTKEDVTALYNDGCTRRWAWPYFLLDECDDGDGAGIGLQLETRYIHQLVTQLRQAGINGITGNWTAAGHFNRALNTYALARMCADASVTPQQVIGEYAAKNATPETAAALAEVLCFIENHSNWHGKMPESHQLEALPTSVADAAAALALLDTVVPLEQGEGTAEPPADYIARARVRLQNMME